MWGNVEASHWKIYANRNVDFRDFNGLIYFIFSFNYFQRVFVPQSNPFDVKKKLPKHLVQRICIYIFLKKTH